MLIVDDHKGTRDSLAITLELYDCETHTASSAEAALGEIEHASYDWVVTDVRMPGMTGVELACALRRRFPGLGLVLMTAYEPSLEERAALMPLSAALLSKPVTAEMLVAQFNAREDAA